MKIMDDGQLTRLLWHDAADVSAATPFCPEDQVIAAYFEGALGDGRLERLRNHLVECRFCQARLGNLARSAGFEEDPPVAAHLLSDAKQMGKSRPDRQAPAWAAAAVIVLAVVLVISSQWQRTASIEPTHSIIPAGGEETRQLRSFGHIPSEIRIVSPSPGVTLTPGKEVHWAAVPDTDHYDVFILSAAGDMVWTERLEGTSWSEQGAEGLVSGSRYYLRVEATLRDGSSVSSRHIDIRFSGR